MYDTEPYNVEYIYPYHVCRMHKFVSVGYDFCTYHYVIKWQGSRDICTMPNAFVVREMKVNLSCIDSRGISVLCSVGYT